jgi:leader peptidase (prepilin peptidase)/N-methyltransferase
MNRNTFVGAGLGISVLAAAAERGSNASISLASALVSAAALGALAAYDLRERRIPNRIVLPATAVCAAFDGFIPITASEVIPAVAVTVALVGVALARPTALGMGDAKLALLVTTAFPAHAAVALILGLFLAAAGGVLVARHRRKPINHAPIALAPFIAAATALVLS